MTDFAPQYVSYIRVSTQKQGQSGLGLEAQREAVRAFVAKRGGEIIAPEYREVESGKKNTRPVLMEAIERCRITGATLLVAKLDRLSRNAAFLMTLKDSKIDFIAADMPDANSMTIGVMALVAQHEADAISDRTKRALAQAKIRRADAGLPPLGGYREKAEKIKKHTARSVAVRKAKANIKAEALRKTMMPLVDEGLTLKAIAARLDAARALTPTSTKENRKAWSAQAVSNLIERLKIERRAA
jgi:DNA invertase Pin-like site-specific DNA recombinase